MPLAGAIRKSVIEIAMNEWIPNKLHHRKFKQLRPDKW